MENIVEMDLSEVLEKLYVVARNIEDRASPTNIYLSWSDLHRTLDTYLHTDLNNEPNGETK